MLTLQRFLMVARSIATDRFLDEQLLDVGIIMTVIRGIQSLSAVDTVAKRFKGLLNPLVLDARCLS